MHLISILCVSLVLVVHRLCGLVYFVVYRILPVDLSYQYGFLILKRDERAKCWNQIFPINEFTTM